MRKVRLVKVVIPEIVAYMGSDPDIMNRIINARSAGLA